MAKKTVKVKFNFKIPKSVAVSAHNTSTVNKIGNTIISMMKALIAKGISPVRGVKRFVAYATQRKNDKTAYPRDAGTKNKFPGKKVRPVNLFLSGEMLKALDFKYQSNSTGIEIGIIGDQKQKTKAAGHQKGTKHLPQRKFLPNKKTDSLNVSIMRSVKAIYLARLKKLIGAL